MIHLVRFTLFLLLCSSVFADTIQHRLQVQLLPNSSRLEVEDTLNLPAERQRLPFSLHAGLSPKVTGGQARLIPLGRSGDIENYMLLLEQGEHSVTLSYGGSIHHAMEEVAESPGRSYQQSRGSIGPEGVFLDASAGWYPLVPDSLQGLELEVTLPPGWLAVSQGAGPLLGEGDGKLRAAWKEPQPQEDIYLVAAPFHLYRSATPAAEAQVYLREEDPTLAQRYLEATGPYLQLYSRLFGDYPYAKFALVENFWDTGYGMPSFTLLGPRVLRLPFIIHTSYPHEILHNWWGNGVYVDYARGNWAEGLTTYLADHLLRERQGQGAAYRRDALQRYADYVREGQDFPLRQFRGRHSSASQSVGYGKGFMLFHMLRRELGDGDFIAGLRRFYHDHRFQIASYADLQHAFEQTVDRDLSSFFTQWLERTGAPTLAVKDVKVKTTAKGYRLTGLLRQTQEEAPFRLQVPLVVHLEQGEPFETRVQLNGREGRFSIELPFPPLRLDVDPRFDLFRTLYPEESPPTLGALFGSERGLILLPSAAPTAMEKQYRTLAESWSRGYSDWKVINDDEIEQLPTDRPVWLLGWENRFREQFKGLLADAALANDSARIDGEAFSKADHSLVLAAQGAGSASQPIAWLGAQTPTALPGLARKLPHYGKYGWLVFSGEAPTNTGKGQWPVRNSPLAVNLGDKPVTAPLKPLPALSEAVN